MEALLVDEGDLEQTARRYGLDSYRDFSALILESDGRITGVLRPEDRPRRAAAS